MEATAVAHQITFPDVAVRSYRFVGQQFVKFDPPHPFELRMIPKVRLTVCTRYWIPFNRPSKREQRAQGASDFKQPFYPDEEETVIIEELGCRVYNGIAKIGSVYTGFNSHLGCVSDSSEKFKRTGSYLIGPNQSLEFLIIVSPDAACFPRVQLPCLGPLVVQLSRR
jgi:hypothetical protein